MADENKLSEEQLKNVSAGLSDTYTSYDQGKEWTIGNNNMSTAPQDCASGYDVDGEWTIGKKKDN